LVVVTFKLRRTTVRVGGGGLALLAGCAVLAGCGGSSARSTLRQTVAADRSIRSGVLTVAVGLRSQPEEALGGPLRLVVQGPFESKGAGKVPAFAMKVGLASGPATIQLGFTSTGSALYLTFGGQPFEVPPSDFAGLEAAYRERSGETPALPAGVEPLQWLENPEKKGTVTVEGEPAEKVRAGINKGRLLASLAKTGPFSGALGELANKLPALHGLLGALSEPSGRKEVGEAVQQASIELEIGKRDHVLRRLQLKVVLAPKGATVARLGGLKRGEVTASFGLSQINAPQRIAAPAHPKPLSELLREAEGAGLSLG